MSSDYWRFPWDYSPEAGVRSVRRDLDFNVRVGPEQWIFVGDFVAVDDPGNNPPDTNEWSPPFENGWANAGPPYAYVAFRVGRHKELEFQGHLDPSGATSGTVAFTLPPYWRPERDVSWLTDVYDGVTATIARVSIDHTTGEVTVVFPVP